MISNKKSTAEHSLNRLELIADEMESSFKEHTKGMDTPLPEQYQHRYLMIKEIRDIHQVCLELLKENAKIMASVVSFIEPIREGVLKGRKEFPPDLMEKQQKILNERFDNLCSTYKYIHDRYLKDEAAPKDS